MQNGVNNYIYRRDLTRLFTRERPLDFLCFFDFFAFKIFLRLPLYRIQFFK